MLALLSEFIRNIGHSITVIVMDREHMEHPRNYLVEPGRVLMAASGVLVGVLVLILSLLLFTPIRYSLPGYGTLEMRREARENQMRLQSMTDSLALQDEYVGRLRDIFLGNVDTDSGGASEATRTEFVAGSSLMELPLPTSLGGSEDHLQPAISFDRLDVAPSRPSETPRSGKSYLSSLSFPVLPPVSGFLTRGFEARTSHYAVDIAVEQGSVIRSIGDGYVIFADWAHDGGQIIAIAHASGYISVFKHNSSLLKQIGDRVRDREVIALSGDSGEITSGPHAHFELWLDGLAQDPSAYVLGW